MPIALFKQPKPDGVVIYSVWRDDDWVETSKEEYERLWQAKKPSPDANSGQV